MTDQLQTNQATPSGDPPRDRQSDSRVFIELQTDAAHRLVIGRQASAGKPHILGLFGFADLLRTIWDAARRGDSYAHWWLLKIEMSLAEAVTVVRAERAAVRQTLSAQTSFGIDATRGVEAHRIDLRFACPYAYYGARLVKQFDSLITDLNIAVQVGARRNADTRKAQRRCERALRRIFSSAQGFQDFGLTHDAIERREQSAIDAEAKMGPLPTEVLNGTRWPSLLDKNDMPITAKSSHGRP